MLAGVSEQLEFDPELLADLKTAVSEACNNVVMHAYPGTSGPMTVRLQADAGTVEVEVLDSGRGFSEEGFSEEDHGLGFAVMNTLSARAEFRSSPGTETAVRLMFPLESSRATDPGSPAPTDLPLAAPLVPPAQVDGEVIMTVSPVSLLAGILGRVAGCIAAEAHFSIDRYSDLYLVTDGIAAYARSHASRPQISAALAAGPRQIDLTVGPFRIGSIPDLTAVTSAPPMLLALLADHVAVESAEDSEAVRLMLIDRRPEDAQTS